jgi:ABC-type transport system substrate-binding protein
MAEWALPIDQPGEGARNYEFDPRTAGRLLAEAGYPQGLETVMNFVSYGSRPYLDTLQLLVRYLDAVGIRVKLVGKEYGAFAVTVSLGQFEATGLGVLPPAVTPYGPLYLRYHPGEVPNAAHVDDPVLTAIS